jgi:hypothetical protein
LAASAASSDGIEWFQLASIFAAVARISDLRGESNCDACSNAAIPLKPLVVSRATSRLITETSK